MQMQLSSGLHLYPNLKCVWAWMAKVIQHNFAGLSEPSMLPYGGPKISFIGSVIFFGCSKEQVL